MTCNLTEMELWSGIDRNAPEIADHLSSCPECQAKAAQLRMGISALTQTTTPTRIPIPDKIGPYTVVRRLGEGGMGIVYEGEQQSPRRPVAIKVIRGGWGADEYRVRLFQREAQTLARLKHPAIAAVYESGRTPDGQHYIVMELVQGEPLNDYVRRRNLSPQDILTLFMKICDAINYAHQRGIIHRDLKPTNILVDECDNPRILDFGLARVTDPDGGRTTITDMGRMMGTLAYMTPEEARGHPEEIDIRSDVYSLGVLLYELMTGRLPYRVKRTALPKAVETICDEPPRRPAQINRTLRGDLETIILKALEKEPDRRYQTAASFSEDIHRFLTDQPILARRTSFWYRLRKFVVRHRLSVVVGVVVLSYTVAVKIFIDRTQSNMRAATMAPLDLKDLEKAIIEKQFGDTLFQTQHLYDEAEPHYRNALNTFHRLGRKQREGPTMVQLAALLIERNLAGPDDPVSEDYRDAEQLLEDALAFYDEDPSGWRDERREALQHLQTLFGPRILDEPELLDEVGRELEKLEREGEPTDPVSPMG